MIPKNPPTISQLREIKRITHRITELHDAGQCSIDDECFTALIELGDLSAAIYALAHLAVNMQPPETRP